jgi:putative transposase
MVAAEELSQVVGTAPACEALTVNRASLYRRRRPPSSTPRRRPTPSRALSLVERQTVRDVLHDRRFVDKAPAQVWATLLDETVYHCSIRTMYRILAAQKEVRERRNQLRHPNYKKPELLATAPNQVWSWDITKLLGPMKWTYYYLYVILDIFSRYVVGWMLALQESARLAKRLIAETLAKQQVKRDQLTIHADRGPSMKSQGVAVLLASLGVTKTHSRPHVSNDNPYSEAQFKTTKYCPNFPDRFGGYKDALAFCQVFFPYYNYEHRHSGIGLMTPYAVHHGLARQITAARQETLLAAYARNPERFVRKPPQPPVLPEAAWINPPPKETTLHVAPGSTIALADDVWVPPDPETETITSSAPAMIEMVQ